MTIHSMAMAMAMAMQSCSVDPINSTTPESNAPTVDGFSPTDVLPDETVVIRGGGLERRSVTVGGVEAMVDVDSWWDLSLRVPRLVPGLHMLAIDGVEVGEINVVREIVLCPDTQFEGGPLELQFPDGLAEIHKIEFVNPKTQERSNLVPFDVKGGEVVAMLSPSGLGLGDHTVLAKDSSGAVSAKARQPLLVVDKSTPFGPPSPSRIMYPRGLDDGLGYIPPLTSARNASVDPDDPFTPQTVLDQGSWLYAFKLNRTDGMTGTVECVSDPNMGAFAGTVEVTESLQTTEIPLSRGTGTYSIVENWIEFTITREHGLYGRVAEGGLHRGLRRPDV